MPGQTAVSSHQLRMGVASLLSVKNYQVMVVVHVTTSTAEIPGAAALNGTALFTKLSITLTSAVATQAYALTLRNMSAALNAVATRYVGQVNLTVSAVTITSESDDDVKSHDGGLTRGGVIGVAVGAVVFCALLLVGLYFAHEMIKQHDSVEQNLTPENHFSAPTDQQQVAAVLDEHDQVL